MSPFARIFSCLLLVLATTTLQAQEGVRPRPSPLAQISMRYKDCYVKVVYSQPHRRGRVVFGELVPYGQVWRTGANEATEITFTHDLLFNGVLVTAGTYSLFTIPEKIKWTIILNRDLGLWGSYNYNPARDVLRFDLPSLETTEMYEPFTMEFHQANDSATLELLWETTRISIPIKFTNP
jgi:hypothetical protein